MHVLDVFLFTLYFHFAVLEL